VPHAVRSSAFRCLFQFQCQQKHHEQHDQGRYNHTGAEAIVVEARHDTAHRGAFAYRVMQTRFLTRPFLRASVAWCRAMVSPRHEQLPFDVLRLCGHRRGTSSEDWRSPKRKDRPLWRSFGTCSSTRLKSRVPALASRQQPWCPSRSRDGDPKNGLTPTGGGLYLFLEEIAGLRSNDKRGSGRLQDAKNGNWKISN